MRRSCYFLSMIFFTYQTSNGEINCKKIINKTKNKIRFEIRLGAGAGKGLPN